MTEDRGQRTERLSRLCRVFVLFSVFCLPSSVYAAPPGSVQAAYEIQKGGIKIGLIEETFTRDKDRYTITSTTRATGLLAIFRPGKIVYSSSGLVGAQGLRPLIFSDLREGEERKNRHAEFDWDAKQLTMIQQAQRTVVPLPDGTQDRISAMYQFMYLPLEKTDVLNFNMTNGSKLDIYNYRITPDQSVTVPLGTFKALYVASVPEPGVNRTEIWLAIEHANLPYKMVITDPDGGKLTQVLTAFSIVK
ncbi:MAG: DUF3108 domain-containing protein [Gallionella sp.]|nr:DUF3108 domain-containing protein [Gallionella sp.]